MVQMWVVSCIFLGLEGTQTASGHFASAAVAWLKGRAEVVVSNVVVEGAHESACVAEDEGLVWAEVVHVFVRQGNPGKSV